MSLGALCLARGEIGANQSRGANKVFFSQFKIGNIFRTGGKRIDSPGEKWQRLGWKTSVRSFGKTPSAPTEGEPPKVGFEGSARGRAFGPACILPTGDQPSVIYKYWLRAGRRRREKFEYLTILYKELDKPAAGASCPESGGFV